MVQGSAGAEGYEGKPGRPLDVYRVKVPFPYQKQTTDFANVSVTRGFG